VDSKIIALKGKILIFSLLVFINLYTLELIKKKCENNLLNCTMVFIVLLKISKEKVEGKISCIQYLEKHFALKKEGKIYMMTKQQH
jgi:hypothetical protein